MEDRRFCTQYGERHEAEDRFIRARMLLNGQLDDREAQLAPALECNEGCLHWSHQSS